MFSTFGVKDKPTAGPRVLSRADNPPPRRNAVPIACEFCKKNRVKCDNLKPCRNCKSRNQTCIHLDSPDIRNLVKSLAGKVEDLEARLEQERGKRETQALEKHQNEHVPPRTVSPSDIDEIYNRASPASNTNHYPMDLSSDCFASKIDQLLSRERVFTVNSAASIMSGIAFHTEEIPHVPASLSRNLQNFYLKLYFRRIHNTLPILDEGSLKVHYCSLWQKDGSRRVSSLVDIVLALALQIDNNAKPQELRQHLEGGSGDGQGKLRLLAHSFYQSSAQSMNREYECPSWSTLQCYILQVHYLQNEWRCNSAYQVLGFAIRAASILDLAQQAPVSTLPREESSVREITRDFLFCLDTQQLIEHGLPCSLPGRAPTSHTMEEPGFWRFYSDLMKIAKSLHILCNSKIDSDSRFNRSNPTLSVDVLENFALASPELCHITSQWVASIPRKYQFRRPGTEIPFALSVTPLIDPDLPVWRLRQALLLELSLHWTSMSFLRWFIDPGVVPNERRDEAIKLDSFAAKAADHAISIIKTINAAHSETDALDGWLQLHKILWDASLTLVAFQLCRPLHALEDEIIHALELAITILDALNSRFTYAAASVLRAVRSAIDSRSNPDAHVLESFINFSGEVEDLDAAHASPDFTMFLNAGYLDPVIANPGIHTMPSTPAELFKEPLSHLHDFANEAPVDFR